jgi:hypothetical protein
MKNLTLQKNGSAIIMMLITMAIFMIVTSAAVTISFINNSSITSITLGDETLHAAESGAEEGLIKLIRSSTYSGESLTIDNADVTITVTDSGPQKVINSEAEFNDYLKKVEVIGSFSNSSFTVSSWKEVD